MRRTKVLSRTRSYLLRLTEYDTKGQKALGENLDDAIHEAYELLALDPKELEREDYEALGDLNASFDTWLQLKSRGLV